MRHLVRALRLLCFAMMLFSSAPTQSLAASGTLTPSVTQQNRLVVFEVFMREG